MAEIGERRVAAEEDAVAAGFDGVAVEAAEGIVAHTSSPVAHLKGAQGKRPDLDTLVPAEFVDGGVASGAQQVGSARGSDDGGTAIFEMAQAADIEVVHVGVREQDEV